MKKYSYGIKITLEKNGRNTTIFFDTEKERNVEWTKAQKVTGVKLERIIKPK